MVYFEIMCIWCPIVVYVGLNVVFLADLFGFHRAPKGTFDNLMAVLMVGPTAMICAIIFFIFKAIQFKFYKKRIEERHEKNNHLNFFE